jgi:hypothetical protein
LHIVLSTPLRYVGGTEEQLHPLLTSAVNGFFAGSLMPRILDRLGKNPVTLE